MKNLIISSKNLLMATRKNSVKGKLIVIDGGDGSGKQTQSQFLLNYLKTKNYPVKYFNFPRYETFYGKIISRFLNGEFGEMEKTSPYLISLAYALDRGTSAKEMRDWLVSGGTIISNRYVTSNMAHQSARLSKEKRKEFISWVEELEYKINHLPKEDLVIYLYVPYKIGYFLTKNNGSRAYLKGKKMDLAEKDLNHRQESEKMYLWLCQNRKNWVKINCLDKNGKMRTREEIHEEIVKLLKEKGIIE